MSECISATKTRKQKDLNQYTNICDRILKLLWFNILDNCNEKLCIVNFTRFYHTVVLELLAVYCWKSPFILDIVIIPCHVVLVLPWHWLSFNDEGYVCYDLNHLLTGSVLSCTDHVLVYYFYQYVKVNNRSTCICMVCKSVEQHVATLLWSVRYD